MTIHTVDVAKFTLYQQDEVAGVVDVCVDDERNIHLRINNSRDEVVMVLSREQARRMRRMIDRAIDGMVEIARS
jgi:hypothetical protein